MRAPRPPLFPALSLSPELDAKLSPSAALLAVLGLGAVARVAHLLALRESPLFGSLQLDAAYYDAWAREIADGTWIGKAAFWVDPLYAYLLGTIYALVGHDLLVPRLFNAALGLGTAGLVALTARRVWGSRTAALAAAVLTLFFVPAIHFEGQLEKTALSVFLMAAAVYLFLLGTSRALLASGAVLGLAVLARGNALVLLPAAIACLALGWDTSEGTRSPKPQRLRRAAIFCGGALPIVALATLHNYAATREFVPTTTNLGINLYLGNHPGNTHGYYEPPPFSHPSTANEVTDFRSEAERRTGESLSDAQLSRYWTGQALEALLKEPGAAVARTLRKLNLALHDDEVPDSDAVELAAEWSPLLRSPLFWFGALVPLVALGGAVGRARREVRIVTAVAILYLLSLLPFFVMARLRVQLLPMAAVLGSGAVVWAIAAVQNRDGRTLLRGLGLVAGVALVCFYRPAWMADRRANSLAVSWNNLGASLVEAGKIDDAIRAYERAIGVRDDAVPAALRSLSQLYEDKGDTQRAEALLRRLVELRPDSQSARERLERLASRNRESVRTALSRARTLVREGREQEAIEVLQDAVRTGPYDEGLRYYLGELMERHATPEAMTEFFTAEIERDPKPQTSRYFRAVGLARAGDVEGAIAELRRALEIDPAHEMSQHKWGLLLEGKGDPAGALEHVLEATRIHPDFRGALEDAARLAERLGRRAEAQALRDRAAQADPNSPRRFLHWARYLHQRGRHLPAWHEVQRMLAERPTDAEARALRDEIRAALEKAGVPVPVERPAPRSAAEAWSLTDEAQSALKKKLSAAPPDSATWIVYDARHPSAEALARELSRAFGEAGWQVRKLAPAGIALKAGVHVFAAEEPSAACRAVADALGAAGFSPMFGTGYRPFVEERRRTDPNFAAIDFEAAQDHVLAVGRKP